MSTPTTDAMASDFVLPYDLEAHEPPEARGLARDGVRLLVSRGGGSGAGEARRSTEGARGKARDARETRGCPEETRTDTRDIHGSGGDTTGARESTEDPHGKARETRGRGGEIGHRTFADLPGLLEPGDLLVVNNSATLPAAVRLDRLAVHFSTEREDGTWLVELRRRMETASEPYPGGAGGEWLPLPGGATLRLLERETPRLWRARLDREVPAYLHRYGVPIRYSYVDEDWPLADYQTVFGVRPGSAEMPSAGRPFTTGLVTELVSRGIGMAPITLHTGVASPEKNEPPYPEWFEVPETTARQVELAHESGSRVIAVGTTVVRALETAALATGRARAARGWTSHIVTPSTGVRAVNGLITGLHEPRSSHLLMLSAIAGGELLSRSYAEALREGYLWHEFGDVHLILS
ncbi:S-adenosylmethionine:tRNA ribosyltransferase-isomerase [Streptosporangium subroseum]|uniref:S-adenosylmethionine:tRNA ribosyltransferase-isomerase n=1 Tax=Streptosporangium subroseum TaxID=106412 RepID=A0A239IFY8_9ACTN|nr:S-adenosylmethionine:tRNA ribosyltransferase-isomerase [Streptosporangium subroseum]SNS92485.1 S-adenosylmethionine:tRNA ribosyltransferase-isomerase [Streptosporangium subroseum]